MSEIETPTVAPAVAPVSAPTRELTVIQMFSRSQVTAVTASAADFGLIFLLTEVFGCWYVLATALGTILGGITSFLMNRHWGFEASGGQWKGQAFRHAASSAISMLFNSVGVWAVTEYAHVHYSISVFGVAIVIGVFVNFPLQRHWVFQP